LDDNEGVNRDQRGKITPWKWGNNEGCNRDQKGTTRKVVFWCWHNNEGYVLGFA